MYVCTLKRVINQLDLWSLREIRKFTKYFHLNNSTDAAALVEMKSTELGDGEDIGDEGEVGPLLWPI